MAIVYLSLGTNVGDRLANLREALTRLGELGTVRACSSVYETEPWGVLDQPDFLNLCCELETELELTDLQKRTKAIERELGRQPGRRWGPRLIDLDLLTYDDQQLSADVLTIPHVGIADRAFVLVPLREIAPSLVVPGLGATVSELLARLPDTSSAVRRVAAAEEVFPSARAS